MRSEQFASAETLISTSSASATPVPLTRGTYVRLEAVERQIADALSLGTDDLLARAAQRDETASDYLSPEALVYFIRQQRLANSRGVHERLFRLLIERCAAVLGARLRSFDPETRKDLRQEILMMIHQDLSATDDRGDFAQVRFWTYLKRKSIDVIRSWLTKNRAELIGDLEADEQVSVERRMRETKDLTPEELTMLQQELARLPPQLRELFIMRKMIGFTEEEAAEHFGKDVRNIRKWLRKAESLLAEDQGTGKCPLGKPSQI